MIKTKIIKKIKLSQNKAKTNEQTQRIKTGNQHLTNSNNSREKGKQRKCKGRKILTNIRKYPRNVQGKKSHMASELSILILQA